MPKSTKTTTPTITDKHLDCVIDAAVMLMNGPAMHLAMQAGNDAAARTELARRWALTSSPNEHKRAMQLVTNWEKHTRSS